MKNGFTAALLILVSLTSGLAAESWRSRIKPEAPGPFPMVRPFEGEFRFGWSGVEAARARAKLTIRDGVAYVDVSGGTNGLARTLWQLDAKHRSSFYVSGIRPIEFDQTEKYAKRSVYTLAAFKPDGLWRKREVVPDPTGNARWKKVKLEPIRDIISAMMFIRSQPLKTGDTVGIIAYPGDSPFLVEATVVKRELIKVGGKSRNALKIDFKLQKIDIEQDNRLAAHGKFRSGSVWLSDDADRFPLRAEVEIFVGYIFGELTSVSFQE